MLISSISKVQQDDRWHGVALVYFRLFFAKNIFLIVLACLFISESIIFRKSWTEAGYGVDEDYSPYVLSTAVYSCCLSLLTSHH
jgi:hypothetical protein